MTHCKHGTNLLVKCGTCVGERKTLRDEYAMAALSGIAAKAGLNVAVDTEMVSEACFRIADAMLSRRVEK